MTIQDHHFNTLKPSSIPELQCRYIAYKLEQLGDKHILVIEDLGNLSYFIKTDQQEYRVTLPTIPLPYCEIKLFA